MQEASLVEAKSRSGSYYIEYTVSSPATPEQSPCCAVVQYSQMHWSVLLGHHRVLPTSAVDECHLANSRFLISDT